MVNGVGFARKTRRSAVLMCAAVAGAAALTLTACSSSSPGSSGSAGSSGSGDIKVALILKEFTNPYWISMEKSAKAEAAKLAAKYAKIYNVPVADFLKGYSRGKTLVKITATGASLGYGAH